MTLAVGATAIAVVSGAVGAGTALVLDPTAAPGPSTSVVAPPPGAVEQVAAKVLPSVVKLETAQGFLSGVGSGVVISADGLILTNDHVVAPPNPDQPVQNTATLTDGRTVPFTIVGSDPASDIAVVKVDGLPPLTPITVGEPRGLHVGQEVVAVGAPLGLEGTVTRGIVSALHRSLPSGIAGDAIQTDTNMNPGSSGGALVDMTGALIGIPTAIAVLGEVPGGSIGLNFAIPADTAIAVAHRLSVQGAPQAVSRPAPGS